MAKRSRPKATQDRPVFYEHPLSAVDRTALRTALTEDAKKKAAEFPDLLEKARTLLRTYSPKDILAVTASYALQVGVTSHEVSPSGFAGGKFGQHHIELLQALAVALPPEEWGKGIALPNHIQEAFEVTDALSEAFHSRRNIELENVTEQEELTIRSIQERLRMHTQIVRNWGYFSDVVTISKELHRPFDDALKAKFGLSATEIIELFIQIMRTVEARSSKRLAMLQRVFRERKPKKMLRAYYKANPHLKDNADQLIRELGDRIHERDKLRSVVLAHSDLLLPDTMTFSVDDLAGITGFDRGGIANILQRLSIAAGELKDADSEHFFMANPVWLKPLVRLEGDHVLCVLPQMFFSFIHEIMESLVADIGQVKQLEERRAAFLENEIERLVAAVLDGAKIVPGHKWQADGKVYETDLVAALDTYILIVEAKSGMLTAPALRGATERAKRHVRELVIHPSEQSARLEGLLRKAREGDADALAQVSGLGMDLSKAKHILRVSVTLSDFNVLTAQEPTFKNIGWLDKNHVLAVNMNIADFKCVLDLLQPSPHLFSYLQDRARLQSSVDVEGDELDWLGLYLATGFNLGQIDGTLGGLMITGMSGPVDKYYTARDAGLASTKLKPQLTKLWEDALAYLAKRKFYGWVECGVSLLQSASFDEQRQIEREFKKVCDRVPRVWREPGHINSVVVSPPAMRDTAIIFFAYPPQLADKRQETAEILAMHRFEQPHIQKAIVFGRQVPHVATPVSFVAMFGRPKPIEVPTAKWSELRYGPQ